MHAQPLEALLDARSDLLRRPAPDEPARLIGLRGGLLPDLDRHVTGETFDITTVITVFRDGLAEPDGPDGQAQLLHLRARIVEVVLARCLVADALQDATEQVAHESAARVADRQRTGGVGRDELDVDTVRLSDFRTSVARAQPTDLVDTVFDV